VAIRRHSEFGRLLRTRRRAAGWTQQELADRSGVSARSLSDLERGVRKPYPRTAALLAGALGLDQDSLAELIAAVEPPAGSQPAAQPPGSPNWVPPRQLPPVAAGFVGRVTELAALSELAGSAGGRRGTVVISAIGGTAGVGKTALALRWAHRAAEWFPDGQLYVNLRGYDPDQPLTASDALARFLRALGVAGQDIPAQESERAARYRTLLAGRRVLVVLDNARQVAQVRPLLPGSEGCLVVVTSRDALTGLLVREGARRLDLDLLPAAEAAALLRELIGDRATAAPEATAALARLCARLPLALRVAADYAMSRPADSLPDLVSELSGHGSRLDKLTAGGDDRTAVRDVFSWSYRGLTPEAAATFRLLGLHPGPDLDDYSTAALAGTTPRHARRLLDALATAYLVRPTRPGRFGLHDLLRAYAREQAAASDADESCHQGLTRLFDYYLAGAAAAMEVLFPTEAYLRPPDPPSAAEVPAMPDQAQARAWLEREWANLVAVVVYCSGHGWPRYATGLAGTLFLYLMNGQHLAEALTMYSHARQVARQSGDLASEASALNGLGSVAGQKGRFGDAVGYYQAALERYRQCGDPTGEAWTLLFLGFSEQQLHGHGSAAGYYRQAMAAYDAAGDSPGVARALVYLATAETKLGSYDEAARHLQLALPVLRDAGHELSEAEALERFGSLNLARGQLTEAAAFFEQSLVIFRRIDFSRGVAAETCNLGEVSLRQGHYQQAISYLRQALVQMRETGFLQAEVQALRILAEALNGTGQPAAARAELTTALRLATETGNTFQQASTHRELADSCHQAGQHEQARDHWRQALVLYTQLEDPEADKIRAQLAAILGR
jgi:tetratricopeptide (TPR) repeat protein/DNA-binding XRE family transcriptional regulator